jgi:exosome complex component RRP4
MAITILPPAREPGDWERGAEEFNHSDMEDDSDGGVDIVMGGQRPAKRARLTKMKGVVTPGEIVTDDPQWMRSVITNTACE